MAEQAPPEHDSHTSVTVTVVASDHVPGVNVRVCPSWAMPARTGVPVMTGPAASAVPAPRLSVTISSNKHSDTLALDLLKNEPIDRRTVYQCRQNRRNDVTSARRSPHQVEIGA